MEVVNITDMSYMYNTLNQFMMNPIVLITLTLIVMVYFLFASSLSPEMNTLGGPAPPSSGIASIFGGIIVFILAAFVILNAVQYFFSINLMVYIRDLFSPVTKIDLVVDQSSSKLDQSSSKLDQSSTKLDQSTSKLDQSSSKLDEDDIPEPASLPKSRVKKQVFNVPGNHYTYENAKAMCSAYGAELATYDQIENAYNKGAEWCNYGWSANQLALFPTQKNTYAELQTIKGHENDCGRPGVNGGYIANPNVKFGVNCYGYKPRMSSEEEDLMKKASPYPETQEDAEFQQKVDKLRSKIDDVLVSPFNYTRWGET